MSHFAELKCDFQQKYEADMIAALETVFGEGNIEVHEDGAALFGYHGDDRSKVSKNSANYAPPCHIVIRRKHIGSASNDIGYRRNEEGGYSAYVSDFDKSATFGTNKQNMVAQEYAVRASERKLKAKGYTVKRTVDAEGRVKLKGTKW